MHPKTGWLINIVINAVAFLFTLIMFSFTFNEEPNAFFTQLLCVVAIVVFIFFGTKSFKKWKDCDDD